MSAPFFTIGIPTHNRAEFLRSCISAALQQTETDFELLILDNASDDATPAVVAAFSDHRIRYQRQPANVGALQNFQDVAALARGTYLVYNQDDDLIHCDFLARCRGAVALHANAVLYAAPMWIGEGGQACSARLLAPRDSNGQAYMALDEVLVLEGNEIAVEFLISTPFNFPAVALHADLFRKTGGFYREFVNGGDIVTLARFATFGRVLYDPRVGAFYRLHGGSSSSGRKKNEYVRGKELKLHRMIGFFDGKGIRWEQLLWKQLQYFSTNELIQEFGLLSRYRAPTRLQSLVYKAIIASWKKPRSRLVRRLLHRVGFQNLMRFCLNQRFGKDLGPGTTLDFAELSKKEAGVAA